MNLLHLNVPKLIGTGKYKIDACVIDLGVKNVERTIRIAAPQLTGKTGHQLMDKNVLNV